MLAASKVEAELLSGYDLAEVKSSYMEKCDIVPAESEFCHHVEVLMEDGEQ